MSDDDAVDALVDAQQRMWSAGDYPAIARHLLPISVDLVDTVGVTTGTRVLDVGVGDGNAAIEAAQRGAVVTGVDLTPSQIDKARARSAEGGLDIELQVGDAEDLDFDDATFDAVVSVMGVIFAPDHTRAVAEMARVCRLRGTVALTAWARDGWGGIWRERVAELLPAPPPGNGPGAGPAPDAWGDPDEVVRRLAAAGLVAEVHLREFYWSFPSSEACADFFLGNAGPFIACAEAAAAAGAGDRLREVLVDALGSVNQATDGTCRAPAPYLLAVASR